jgi:hypothetical protein
MHTLKKPFTLLLIKAVFILLSLLTSFIVVANIITKYLLG